MKYTVIYRKWRETGYGVFIEHVIKATEGVNGVKDLYIRDDGLVCIRMEDPEAIEYWIPMGQVLAIYQESDHVGED